MNRFLSNIAGKIASVIAIISVLSLNFFAVVQCGAMLLDDDCCHITNTVKPCCLKNLKVTIAERISSHCGCSMKEAQQPSDMYVDLSSAQHKNYSHSLADFEQTASLILSPQNDIQNGDYSPPIITYNNVYLFNMNLRI